MRGRFLLLLDRGASRSVTPVKHKRGSIRALVGRSTEKTKCGLCGQKAFAPGGGYVFGAVHNVQALTPPANLLALFATLKEYR